MNILTAGRLAGVALLAALAIPCFAAREAKATVKERAPVLKKPTLIVDASPVDSDARAPVVTSYADVVTPAQKAVVSVYSTKFVRQRIPVNPLFRQFFGDQAPARESKEQGLGSGVVVSPDGFILTNNHVVEGADELNVALPDGRELRATLIGADPKTDIAVIKIDADQLPSLVLADSDKLRVGDLVFAVGNPLGVGQTVTMGIVSAKGRNNLGLLEGVAGYEDFIQTDAAINMGNSGGALIDAKGRLVGINSAIITTSRGNIGIGLAIPVNLAANIMHSLIDTGSVTRGYLGVEVEPVTPDNAETLGLPRGTKAIVVTNVIPGGPAMKAGLKNADAILSINGRPVASPEDLRLLVSQLPPDTKITLTILRDGKEKTLSAQLGQLADTAVQNELLQGVVVMQLTDEIRRVLSLDPRLDGLVVADVEPESPYADRMLPGMLILEINRRPVSDLASAHQAIRPGRNLFLVYARGVYRYVTVVVTPPNDRSQGITPR